MLARNLSLAGSLLCAEDTSPPPLVCLSIQVETDRIRVQLTVTSRGLFDDFTRRLVDNFWPTWIKYQEAQVEQWQTLSEEEKVARFHSFPHVKHIPSARLAECPGLIEEGVPARCFKRNYGSIYDILYPPSEDSDLFADDDPEDEVPLVDWSTADKLLNYLQSEAASK